MSLKNSLPEKSKEGSDASDGSSKASFYMNIQGQVMITKDYEKLGAFYLGRNFDPQSGQRLSEPLLYDAKDLTTHGLLIGMTGSGKTGLATALIEEAIIDGIPVLAIDPKGDLGNLFLSFPELKDEDFAPWIDPVAAGQKGCSTEEYARKMAALWQHGLAEWGQDGERIKRYIGAADRKLYTPGSRSGTPLSLLSTLSLPRKVIMEDDEALRDRIQAAASGLLALLGIEADPMQSREHILLSILLNRSWKQGSSLDLATLIMQIQTPPVERVGILEVDAFFPKKDRVALAIGLNNLLASPGFEAWMEGEPLDAGALLFNSEGKPRLSVIAISHLNDNERMFVVTCLLNSLISWMRSQPGSGSLRALVYMDEIYGYLPPVANPPSKVPLLTLLKQARAFGIGLTLATQNPVDLDYKALSNAGTWFLGRLQTERDKQRVIDGLEGAASGPFNRSEIESLLGRLDSRQFLLHNVHEDMPVTFETRWVLNYLAGPLTRKQIQAIALQQETDQSGSAEPPIAVKIATQKDAIDTRKVRPQVPENLSQGYAALNCQPSSSQGITYRPFLLGVCHVHYSHQRLKVDEWQRISWITELGDNTQPWRQAKEIDMPEVVDKGLASASYLDLPKAARSGTALRRWQSQLKTVLYQQRKLERYVCKDPKAYSLQEEAQAEFRGRLLNLKRQQRDLQVEKLRQKYTPKLRRVQEQILTAEQRLQKEQQQVQDKKVEAGLSFGATLLGALFGRKLASASNISRASKVVRGTRRIAKEKQDVALVQQKLQKLQVTLAGLEQQFEDNLQHLQSPLTYDQLVVKTTNVSCRKTDTDIEEIMLLWVPFISGADGGEATPAAAVFARQDY